MACMSMPGIIGTSIEKAIGSAPQNVSLAYANGDGDQNTSGANNSQMPVKQVPHCAQRWRQNSDSVAKIRISVPLPISLQANIAARAAGGDRPRSWVTRITST